MAERKVALEHDRKEVHGSHKHNVDHVEHHYGGDGHKAAHHHYKEHSAGQQLHHEHVKAMCGGGKA